MDQQTGPRYFTEEHWSDDAIAAWLASLFDHAGKLDLRARGAVLTFESRDSAVMHALRARFGVGDVRDQLEGRPLTVWAITQPADVFGLLMMISAYLTTRREAVRQALNKLTQLTVRTEERQQQDREIVALWLSDRSKNSIAKVLGVSYAAVVKAIAAYQHKQEPIDEAVGRPMARRSLSDRA